MTPENIYFDAGEHRLIIYATTPPTIGYSRAYQRSVDKCRALALQDAQQKRDKLRESLAQVEGWVALAEAAAWAEGL